jgi:hypothetical protein
MRAIPAKGKRDIYVDLLSRTSHTGRVTRHGRSTLSDDYPADDNDG